MKLLTILSGALLAAGSTAHPGRPHWGGSWGGHHGDHSHRKAVYFLRVDPSGSNVVAIAVGENGMLEDATSVTSTGGIGQQSINATSGLPTVIDPLQGQQAVSIGGDYLFTINSGSDTAVMFKIDPYHPLKLTMVGQPAPTLGQFAMSITYSSKYQKACVLNGGAINGVACYNVDAVKGLIPDGVGLREYGFAGTTPPQLFGAKGSGSDIQFTGDSSKLVTTFKGNAKPRVTLSHVSIFNVDDAGNVAKKPTDNRVSPSTAAFGFALSGSNLDQFYVSDAAFGGVLLQLDPTTDKVSLLATVNETAFAASCWSVWCAATDSFVDIPAGSPNIGIIDSSGNLIDLFDYDSALGGGVDAVVDGTILYMLTATNVIARIDLESGQVLQEFTYSSTTDRPFWTGMAMWPANPLLSGNLS